MRYLPLVTLLLAVWSQFTYAQNLEKIEKTFLELQDSNRFKKHLYNLTQEPHIAGSPENERVRDYIAKSMREAGLKVEIFPYDVYLPVMPGSTSVELVKPIRMPLNNREYIYDEDPYSSHPALTQGFNAFTGSGDVTGEVIYVNYGRKEDFDKLKEMGHSVEGKIVLARYGGNFRGYKAKYAEENGAIGLIIFTDPNDSGYMKGLVYPEGPYFDESSIQRGSLLVLPWIGDPLTPKGPALPLENSQKINRLKPHEVPGLLSIPVMPLSYGSAKEILSRMKGEAVPSGWQGGLPFTYRITGGNDLIIRLNVHQERKIQRIYNVVGTLHGSKNPDEWIVLGSHYDAWNFGTLDPNSGTAMLLCLSESLGHLAKNGMTPLRTIKIAHWDAEELGLFGSTEWVEQHKDELSQKCIAYLNADGAVSGRNFGGSASPLLKNVFIDASRGVIHPDSSKLLHDVWRGKEVEPKIGNLGGGSDHLPFLSHLGIPSISAGTSGTSIYHSIFDNFHFYQKFADSTFKMGPMVERVFGLTTLKLANEKVIPYDLSRYGTDIQAQLSSLEKSFSTLKDGHLFSFDILKIKADSLTSIGVKCQNSLSQPSIKNIEKINQKLISLDRKWLEEGGLQFGEWYKSLYASSDPYSGYASWILPALHYELSLKTTKNLHEWEKKYLKAMNDIEKTMVDIIKLTE